MKSNMRQFRICEQAVWNLPACGHAINTVEVVMHHTEVVDADVCELRAARNLADRPNAERGGLKSLVDINISAFGQFDSGQFQSESFGIRSAAQRNQHMAALQGLLSSILLDDDAN